MESKEDIRNRAIQDRKIIIKGAREHNLQNIDLTLPRDQFIVITGLSGSGKSSLAFDTIYAEGQRRYVESLSAYARQFLGQMEKPEVDYIEGLSPAISIDQKTTRVNPRSTVGTVTEIYDYLRLLYARIGIAHCYNCGKEISQQTPGQIAEAIIDENEHEKIIILAPVIKDRKGMHQKIFESYKEKGFVRARVDGEILSLDDEIKLNKNNKHTIEIVIDRLKVANNENFRKRYDSDLDYITKHESQEQTTKKAKDSTLIVLGSGNLGLIYLTQWTRRLYYEEIISLFPNLIPGLVKHSGIGFVLVNSYTNGPMVIGSDGIYYLDNDEIVGKNPLENFGKNATMHLKRHNTFKHMPDILVNSSYNPENEEIYSFEELIGSHGGLGGSQTRPFILYPSYWKDPGELVGAKSIYDFLKEELENLKNS